MKGMGAILALSFLEIAATHRCGALAPNKCFLLPLAPCWCLMGKAARRRVAVHESRLRHFADCMQSGMARRGAGSRAGAHFSGLAGAKLVFVGMLSANIPRPFWGGFHRAGAGPSQ